MGELNQTRRTTINRVATRASYDCKLIKETIKTCIIGHLSFLYNNSVHSIPLPFWCVDEYIYCHCSAQSQIASLSDATSICVSFAIIDALVMAKSAFRHSFNYRSVVVYGEFTTVECDQEKMKAMENFMSLFDKDRWNKIRIPNKKELNATAILKLPLHESVAKIRSGPPNDLKSDKARDVWSGIIPRLYSYGSADPTF